MSIKGGFPKLSRYQSTPFSSLTRYLLRLSLSGNVFKPRHRKVDLSPSVSQQSLSSIPSHILEVAPIPTLRSSPPRLLSLSCGTPRTSLFRPVDIQLSLNSVKLTEDFYRTRERTVAIILERAPGTYGCYPGEGDPPWSHQTDRRPLRKLCSLR